MDSSPSVTNALVSGTFAGWASTMVGQPFEAVRVRSQLRQGVGLASVAVETVKERALYRGTTPALVSAVTENGVVFAANSLLKRVYNPANDRELTLGETAMIGGVAGVFSATAICPAETTKVRMLANPGAWRGAMDCFARSVREEGARSMFRGLPAQIARDVPFNFAFFGSYETITRGLARVQGRDKSEFGPATHVFAGGLAGAASWFVTMPMDVVKSRAQAMCGACPDESAAQVTSRVVRDVYREWGVRGFFRGFTAAAVRAFPVNGALFASYEFCEKRLLAA